MIKKIIQRFRTWNNLRKAPKTLEECFTFLDKEFYEKERFKAHSEEETCLYHFSTGMWMRNNWGLWAGSPLKDYFNNLGIYHPDDMSGIILTSWHRKLHGKDIDLEGQIKYYQDYWNDQSVNHAKKD